MREIRSLIKNLDGEEIIALSLIFLCIGWLGFWLKIVYDQPAENKPCTGTQQIVRFLGKHGRELQAVCLEKEVIEHLEWKPWTN